MSYFPPQTYGQYQTQYPHYPSQYPAQGQPLAGYPVYPPGQAKPATPPPEPHTAPELSAVSPELASHALQRLVSAELRGNGFETAEPATLIRLELEVAAWAVFTVVERLYERAHDYANLANRAGPIAKDLLFAAEERGFQMKELHQFANKSKSRQQVVGPLRLLPPPRRSPSPELLPSDDENAPPVIPATLRSLPWGERQFPALPPKHTYLRTPVVPQKRTALPSLEKKLKTAGLVQESLKNLLTATEDNTGQEDGELLGALVNWEATTHPRKRWKLSA
ncbi:uncharacterized protein LAESUDRAFT_753960 [Laetiporus sulphureus 93-53]|uniref:Transcription initiation factor TFIID subunit 8 n=1 Tax=Laetiporus sulphureus 93-53 TaxID=1314785 RepID=A0A165IDD7_9APHY|nr:uncharacterized protein LAESUDRAFT_753960 [Laetiporus sulphureus 93-53]KZT12925.1 hypothetical protein LAESUDRAFT_753960 [Laetiporus sulphureus 93-53]